MQEKKLKLDNICKSFNTVKVLDHLSVDVSKGEHVTLLGPSGCGKSTIMNIITGILDADEGTVSVNGKIGYMQQKDLLLPWKTCIENVILPEILAGTPKKEAISKAQPFFKAFLLEGFENSFPGEMSGGMRQRASFLRTFMSSGDILLLDEPFGAVDSITRGTLQRWLIDISSELDLTILMITHDIDEAILLSDRIYILSDKPTRICDEIRLGEAAHKSAPGSSERVAAENRAAEKKDRLLDPEFLKIRKRILDDLKQSF